MKQHYAMGRIFEVAEDELETLQTLVEDDYEESGDDEWEEEYKESLLNYFDNDSLHPNRNR